MRYLYWLLVPLSATGARGQVAADTLVAAGPSPEAAEIRRYVVSQTDSAGRCTETLRWGGEQGLVRIYYASGRLKEYRPYADLGAGLLHGVLTTWHESGQLESRQPFNQGQRDGQLELYYATGQLKRRTRYEAGAELPGQCFDAAGQPVAYFPYEQLPLYPGGQAQLTKEISAALRWPRGAPPVLGTRTVGVSFVVAKDGSVQAPRVVMSSKLASIDRAVLASVAKLGRRFAPARRDGAVVLCSYYLPIRLEQMGYLRQFEKN